MNTVCASFVGAVGGFAAPFLMEVERAGDCEAEITCQVSVSSIGNWSASGSTVGGSCKCLGHDCLLKSCSINMVATPFFPLSGSWKLAVGGSSCETGTPTPFPANVQNCDDNASVHYFVYPNTTDCTGTMEFWSWTASCGQGRCGHLSCP